MEDVIKTCNVIYVAHELGGIVILTAWFSQAVDGCKLNSKTNL